MNTYWEEFGEVLVIALAFPLLWFVVSLVCLIFFKQSNEIVKTILNTLTIVLFVLQTGVGYYFYIWVSLFEEVVPNTSSTSSHASFLTLLAPGLLYFLAFFNDKIIKNLNKVKF